ncbi:unnamed protein product [Trifolium pratense]|uniref:Uncharacterized protein n=1 Tax=Trifolium pratense TaxID=57577 RepID=A0ACB0M8U8_TRIPR|nr:unnamed protein product [Trifolium pratense]
MTTPLVTAAFRSSQRNQYYVFNNEKYVVLDYGRGFDKKTRVIGGPIHIADGFPMFANTPFAIGIDGSFDNDGNDTFFFKGDQCVKVDFAPDIGDSRLLMVIFIITAAILTTAAASPLALTLERAFPSNNGIDLDQLRARDTTRHGRILKSSKDVVYFDVYGNSQLPLGGLYYTNISLGTPPVEFHVQIDTGSDVTWVSCSSCNGCPQTSGLEIELKFF